MVLINGFVYPLIRLPSHIFFCIIQYINVRGGGGGGVVYFTVMCDHPFLVLFAVLVCYIINVLLLYDFTFDRLGHGDIEDEGKAMPLRVETMSMLK